MKIAAINSVDYGSTGRIMTEIAMTARKAGHEYYTYSVGHKEKHKPPEGHKYYLGFLGNMIHYVLGRITGANGFFSVIPTIRLAADLRKIQPDIIHLHTIHGFCINIPILLYGIKRSCSAVVWTFHDCWAFTGHCPHYELIGCSKWKTGCFRCPLHKDYPESFPDHSKWMWKYKKKHFNRIRDLTIVTPSRWLEAQVRQSFLQDKPVQTIYNGIRLNAFRPISSDFRQKYHLEGKKIVLGVAFRWGKEKGLDVFQKLAASLPDEYKIVLVGTTEENDKILDSRILSIHKTTDQQELTEIYSAADVFVNPTRQDTFPTVNIEALACGTPVITFRSGGSPEIIDDQCGLVVEKDDIYALKEDIVAVCQGKSFSSDDCTRRAAVFQAEKSYQEYVALYEAVYQKHYT